MIAVFPKKPRAENQIVPRRAREFTFQNRPGLSKPVATLVTQEQRAPTPRNDARNNDANRAFTLYRLLTLKSWPYSGAGRW
jgi:hypothetical protein